MCRAPPTGEFKNLSRAPQQSLIFHIPAWSIILLAEICWHTLTLAIALAKNKKNKNKDTERERKWGRRRGKVKL